MTVPLPEYGGCLWPIDPSCLQDEWDLYSDDEQERALALASTTLHRLTGYRVGGCPVTVRPCTPRQFPAAEIANSFWYGGAFTPLNYSGVWLNVCRSNDGCSTPCTISLPPPVGGVVEVKVDGVVLNPSVYSVNGRYLSWIGTGDCPFPEVQNLALPDTAPGTFSVTYLNAYPVDRMGAQAVTILALEFAKACAGKGKCRLPSGVTTLVRQGVTMEIDPGTFPKGTTGIREVDTYIALWNPDNRRPSTVWRPDRHRV